MVNFYKIENGQLISGSGLTPPDDTFIVYEDTFEPQELLDAIEKERLVKEAQDTLLANKQAREQSMLDGVIYPLNGTDYNISFTKNDGDGLVQVKSAFELGLTDTKIHFDNGTVMPINSSDFGVFALWFVNKRNEFFL